ncbi:MAG: hypothetical protein KAV83_02895 [Desulfobacterales bacterium]|nr:hypothetical protein [Desulfobacterales bacterium]
MTTLCCANLAGDTLYVVYEKEGLPFSDTLLDMAIRERIERFKALAQKMPESARRYRAIVKEQANEKLLRQKQELFDRWQDVEAVLSSSLENPGDPSVREPFLERLNKHIKEKGTGYVAVIQGLDKIWSAMGTKWLQGIVDAVNEQALEVMPSYNLD